MQRGWRRSGNDGTKSGIYATGFIPCVAGDKLYCENVGMQTGQDSHRLCLYDESKVNLNTVKTSISEIGSWMTFGEDGNVATITISHKYSNARFMRLCCGYLGEDSVITVNEEIV